MGNVFALRLGNGRYLPLSDLDRPVQVTRLFTTLADGQRKAIFNFYLRGRGGGWRPVGRIEWEALPPSRAGEPTLELRLIPGRAGGLLLQLRERSSGAVRSFHLRLPEVLPEVLPEPSPEPPRPKSKPARRKTSLRRREARQGGRRGARLGRLVIGLALAVLLLAIAAVLVIRFTPLKEALAGGKPTAGPGSTAQAAQAPAQAPPAVPALQPEHTDAGESGSGAADAASGATPQVPAAQAEPAASAPDAVPADEPRSPNPTAEKSVAEKPAEALSYRVQWGDTLWHITEQYYGNPYLYSLLAGENAIVDPDLIIPGTELRLPPRIDDRGRK